MNVTLTIPVINRFMQNHGYLTRVAFKAPDVVLLVQRHQSLPVLEILRAAGAPVLQRTAPVGRRLNLLRPTRLGDDVGVSVEAVVPIGVLLLPGAAVPVGRGGRFPALDALLTEALFAGEGHPLA